jgi:hypothetical protein
MVRFLSAASLLFAAVAKAVLVPADLAPGMYAIPFDDNGDALTPPIALGDVALEKRQNNGPGTLPQGQVTCGTNGNLNIAVWNSAKDAFQAMCDSHPEAYEANIVVLYTSGNTLAYMCNFGRPNRCWRSEYQNVSEPPVDHFHPPLSFPSRTNDSLS